MLRTSTGSVSLRCTHLPKDLSSPKQLVFVQRVKPLAIKNINRPPLASELHDQFGNVINVQEQQRAGHLKLAVVNDLPDQTIHPQPNFIPPEFDLTAHFGGPAMEDGGEYFRSLFLMFYNN